MITITQILNNADNHKVFEFLKLDANKNISLKSGDEVSGYDEGGVVFFDNYAEFLPNETKQIIDGMHNILVNEHNGRIFAFHFGRFTFAFRCDFEKNKIDNSKIKQTGYTLDDYVDIRSLGKEWTLLNDFFEEEQEQLLWSYELSKKTI